MGESYVVTAHKIRKVLNVLEDGNSYTAKQIKQECRMRDFMFNKTMAFILSLGLVLKYKTTSQEYNKYRINPFYKDYKKD